MVITKTIVLLQLFSKNELKDGIKAFLEPNFFSTFSQIYEIRVFLVCLFVPS